MRIRKGSFVVNVLLFKRLDVQRVMANGRVIMYADKITDSMQKAIDETNRRRAIQEAYNKEHGIVPKTIVKNIRDLIAITHEVEKRKMRQRLQKTSRRWRKNNAEKRSSYSSWICVRQSKDLDFEKAADLRDVILELRAEYRL